MTVKSSQSRLDSNREIRRILVKNSVDTTKIQYSCHARFISLSGGIYNEGGEEISLSKIEAIFNELNRMGYKYHCDFDNWIVSEGSISKKGAKAKEVPAQSSQQEKKTSKSAA